MMSLTNAKLIYKKCWMEHKFGNPSEKRRLELEQKMDLAQNCFTWSEWQDFYIELLKLKPDNIIEPNIIDDASHPNQN